MEILKAKAEVLRGKVEGFEGKYENAKLNLRRQAWLDVGRCFLNILASSSQMPSQSLYCQLKVNRKTPNIWDRIEWSGLAQIGLTFNILGLHCLLGRFMQTEVHP